MSTYRTLLDTTYRAHWR